VTAIPQNNALGVRLWQRGQEVRHAGAPKRVLVDELSLVELLRVPAQVQEARIDVRHVVLAADVQQGHLPKEGVLLVVLVGALAAAGSKGTGSEGLYEGSPPTINAASEALLKSTP